MPASMNFADRREVMNPIREIDAITPSRFREEILAAGQPAVFRGLLRDWPLVQAGSESDEAFCTYVKQFERGYDIDTAYGAPSIGGRFFYNADLSGLNCRMGRARLSASLDYVLEHRDDEPAPSLAIQSVVISGFLPGMQDHNRLPAGYLPEGTEPRFWVGSRATVAAHYDASENIACCVAGSRRFTLFPPEQVSNLYVGPFELTPAGATISMVDFDHPDYDAFPRFRDAEAAAQVADLAPGDVLYIPYLWWHHVRSRGSVNALVNYWWERVPAIAGDPRNVLLHAMMAMRSLPASYRDAWRSLFEHYVFAEPTAASEHLPPARRGVLGELGPEDVKRMRLALSRALSRN